MPGHHISDQQVFLFMTHRRQHTQAVAAAKAGISERSARRIENDPQLPSQKKKERHWRTRADPLEPFWPRIEELLQIDGIIAVTVFETLQDEFGEDAVPDGTPVFANVELVGRKLIVEVNSAARAEQAITHMREWLGDCVSTPMTEIRTMAQFMADDAARAPQEEPLDIPSDERERIVHEMLTREYTKTLDEAVPALGNKTPRALARTKAGLRIPTMPPTYSDLIAPTIPS